MSSFELSTFACLSCSNFFASLQSFSVKLINTENMLQGLVGAPQRPSESPPTFTCDHCGVTFNIKRNLSFHRKEECPERNITGQQTKDKTLSHPGVIRANTIESSNKVPAQRKEKVFSPLPCGYRGCNKHLVDFQAWRHHQVRKD